MSANHHVHGDKGVYHAGDWVPIEECANIIPKNPSHKTRKSKCGNDCATCPRSATCPNAVREETLYDVIIIGAGCIGAAIARELAKTNAKVLWLEAADDVAQGATKGNSGIVHAGFDDKPGTNRAKFCWRGNQMFSQLDAELNFGYQKNGSLVLAKSDDDMKHLEELLQRGITNGVQNLKILSKDEVFAMEPNLHADVVGALYAPEAGNLIPYEYAIALAENAVDNGVELLIRREVQSIDIEKQEGEADTFKVNVRHWEPKAYLDAVKLETKNVETPKSSSDEVVPKKDLRNDGNATSLMFYSSLLIGMAAFLIYQAETLSASYKVSVEIVLGVGCGILVIGSMFALKVMFTDSASASTTSSVSKSEAPSPSSEKASFPSMVAKASPPVGQSPQGMIDVETMKVGGSGSSQVQQGETVSLDSYRSRYVINCAGSFSDRIANMIGDDSFVIHPRLGDYLLLSKAQGSLVHHTLFPCPDKMGKGVLVQTTLWGNLILGPTARDVEKETWTIEQIHDFILSKCRALVPSFDSREIIHAFSGARAKSSRGDWILEASAKHPHFLHAAGIDSPGLAGSPAIAQEMVRLLQQAGLTMESNPSFNPYRAPIVRPKNSWKGIRATAVEKSSSNPDENIVCKCEKVTEAEVVEAIHRSLPVDSTQAIRKRTRAGMGNCQGNPETYNCECRVAAILARELDMPLEAVGRRPWPATSSLPQRWMTEEQREALAQI